MTEVDLQAAPAIEVSDLSLNYGSKSFQRGFKAVEGLTFNVNNGETLAVLGESGSGKSTLIRFIAGLAKNKNLKKETIHAVQGDATTLGVSLTKMSRSAQRKLTAFVNFLPQDAGAKLDPDLNLGDIIFRPIEERIKKFDRSQLGESVAELFDSLALPLSFLQKYPYELSKGQRQRVALARSILTKPKVLIADEPTLGVDSLNRPRIIETLRKYHENESSTMVLVSHDISLLETLTDDVLILQQGQAVGYGDINNIFRKADHGYVFQLAQALRNTAYDEIANE